VDQVGPEIQALDKAHLVAKKVSAGGISVQGEKISRTLNSELIME
jgi:hypothetical protein